MKKIANIFFVQAVVAILLLMKTDFGSIYKKKKMLLIVEAAAQIKILFGIVLDQLQEIC